MQYQTIYSIILTGIRFIPTQNLKNRRKDFNQSKYIPNVEEQMRILSIFQLFTGHETARRNSRKIDQLSVLWLEKLFAKQRVTYLICQLDTKYIIKQIFYLMYFLKNPVYYFYLLKVIDRPIGNINNICLRFHPCRLFVVCLSFRLSST